MLANQWALATLVSATLGTAMAAGPVRLHTVLETGKQVVFSGQQRAGFRLKIHNSGGVAVLVTERQAGGLLQARGRIQPYQKAVLLFGTGSAAVVRSVDSWQAEFDVKFFNAELDGVIIRYESTQ